MIRKLTLLRTAGTWPGGATIRNGGGSGGGTRGTATSGSAVGGRAGDQTFRRRLRRRTGTLTRGAQRLLGNYTTRNSPTSQQRTTTETQQQKRTTRPTNQIKKAVLNRAKPLVNSRSTIKNSNLKKTSIKNSSAPLDKNLLHTSIIKRSVKSKLIVYPYRLFQPAEIRSESGCF